MCCNDSFQEHVYGQVVLACNDGIHQGMLALPFRARVLFQVIFSYYNVHLRIGYRCLQITSWGFFLNIAGTMRGPVILDFQSGNIRSAIDEQLPAGMLHLTDF